MKAGISGGVACGLVLALTACADAVTLNPTPEAARNPSYSFDCGVSVPCFESPEEIPDNWDPHIISKSPIVYWNGSTAVASSTLRYYGNRAEESFVLSISGKSMASRTAQSASNGGLLPGVYTHSTPGFTLTATGGSCGHLAELSSQHSATVSVWFNISGFQSNSVTEPGGDSDRQPACPCGGGGGGGNGGGELVENTSPLHLASANTSCGEGGSGGGGPPAGGTMRCYTITTEHYWYHPDTGTYEYRYTDTSTWCELIE